MSFEYSIDAGQKRVTVRLSRPSGLQESLDAMSIVVEDPSFQKHFAVLVDIREQDFTPSPEDVFVIQRKLVSLHASYFGPVAILAAPGLRFGLMNMIANVVEALAHKRFQAFVKMEEAAQWLSREMNEKPE